jgi:hypothetical protein
VILFDSRWVFIFVCYSCLSFVVLYHALFCLAWPSKLNLSSHITLHNHIDSVLLSGEVMNC